MAQATAQTVWTPRAIRSGPEMDALTQFFFDCTWEGTVYPDMQGPGSPEMEAVGSMTCRPIMDGLWLECDGYQDQFANGEKLVTWKLHLVIGWDVTAREYRAVLVDSNGTAALLRGEIEGSRLVMTPAGTVQTAGQIGTIRVVWDATDPTAVRWINEASVNGGPWMLIEDYVMEPID